MIPATAQPDAAPVALPVRAGRGRYQPARQIELVLPAVLQSAHIARGHAEAALNVWDLAHLIDSAVLIASELVSNAISASTEKAPPGKEGRPVILSIAARDGELLTRVWDPDPALTPDEPSPDDPLPEGGRGLLIIAELSRQWGWHPGNGGKYVWASLPLSPPADLTRPRPSSVINQPQHIPETDGTDGRHRKPYQGIGSIRDQGAQGSGGHRPEDRR